MNTFLPFFDLIDCARALSPKHLNKQISECRQIVQALTGRATGYRYHPAVRMYGPKSASFVALFGDACCREQYRRTGNWHEYSEWLYRESMKPRIIPWWLGNLWFHRSHQGVLLWKDPEWYGSRLPGETPKGKPCYVWPVHRRNWRCTEVVPGQQVVSVRKKEWHTLPVIGVNRHGLTPIFKVGDNRARYLLEQGCSCSTKPLESPRDRSTTTVPVC
jgi:hypothetical protein